MTDVKRSTVTLPRNVFDIIDTIPIGSSMADKVRNIVIAWLAQNQFYNQEIQKFIKEEGENEATNKT